MSANCGDYGERRGVGICNEFPIAFMPHILWLCASAIQAKHPQGLETDKSDMGGLGMCLWMGIHSNTKCSQIGSIYSFSFVGGFNSFPLLSYPLHFSPLLLRSNVYNCVEDF